MKTIFLDIDGVIQTINFRSDNSLKIKNIESTRAKEIIIKCKELNINNFVVIDDIDMSTWFGERMIHCSEERLTSNLLYKAIQILNGK